MPESRLFVFNPFPGFKCIVAALKSRTVAHKTRTKVSAEVCSGYKYKDDTILFPCISFDPGFEYKQLSGFRDINAANSPSEDIVGFEYRVTPAGNISTLQVFISQALI